MQSYRFSYAHDTSEEFFDAAVGILILGRKLPKKNRKRQKKRLKKQLKRKRPLKKHNTRVSPTADLIYRRSPLVTPILL